MKLLTSDFYVLDFEKTFVQFQSQKCSSIIEIMNVPFD